MKYVFLSVVLILFAACGDKDCTDETFDYKITDGTYAIDSSGALSFNYTTGTDKIFEYIQEDAQCDNIADDERGERLIFQISSEEETISLKDGDLSSVKCVYSEFGAWVSSIPWRVDKGTLIITKMSETEWQVDANVRIDIGDTRREVTFNEVFIL